MVKRVTQTYEDKPRGDFKFDELEDGEYKCTLTIKDCEVPVWVDGKPTSQTKDGVRFTFKVDGKAAWVNKTATNSLSDRGGLIKMMRMCHDSMLTQISFNERGFVEDESVETFYQLLEQCADWKYIVWVKHKHHENGNRYCNFVKCQPLMDEKVGVAKIDPKYDTEQVSFEEDEIPF